MKTKKRLMILIIVSSLSLLVACETAEEFVSYEDTEGTETPPLCDAGEGPRIGPAMMDPRLISIWDDTMYFVYTHCYERIDGGWPLHSTNYNHLARMQVDGTGLHTFGGANPIRAQRTDAAIFKHNESNPPPVCRAAGWRL